MRFKLGFGCPLLAQSGQSTRTADELCRFRGWWSGSAAGIGKAIRLRGRNRQSDFDDRSVVAGGGQFRWQSWSNDVAKVGRWLAFSSTLTLVIGIMSRVALDFRMAVADATKQ